MAATRIDANDTVSETGAILGLGWLTLPTAQPEEIVSAAAAAGFDAVGLRVAPRPGDRTPALVDDLAQAARVEVALATHGISLYQMGSIWLDGGRPIAWCRPALELGAALGARQLIALAAPGITPDRLISDFSRLCEWADALDMKVAIEFAHFLGVADIGQADRLIDASGMGNAGMLVDALHLARSGGTPRDVRTIAPERIHFAQICDAPAQAPEASRLAHEARHDRLDAGEGGLPLRAFVQALPAGTALEVEAPCQRYLGLSAHDRAGRAASAVRSLMDGVYRRSVGCQAADPGIAAQGCNRRDPGRLRKDQ